MGTRGPDGGDSGVVVANLVIPRHATRMSDVNLGVGVNIRCDAHRPCPRTIVINS